MVAMKISDTNMKKHTQLPVVKLKKLIQWIARVKNQTL